MLICRHLQRRGARILRIVLSNIGTFGDINPLIALSLELKRRGHTPVLALPAVYQPKIAPLGIEFNPIRPDIDPTNTILVEMIYDVVVAVGFAPPVEESSASCCSPFSRSGQFDPR